MPLSTIFQLYRAGRNKNLNNEKKIMKRKFKQ